MRQRHIRSRLHNVMSFKSPFADIDLSELPSTFDKLLDTRFSNSHYADQLCLRDDDEHDGWLACGTAAGIVSRLARWLSGRVVHVPMNAARRRVCYVGTPCSRSLLLVAASARVSVAVTFVPATVSAGVPIDVGLVKSFCRTSIKYRVFQKSLFYIFMR